jgi:glycosyltransferase XagB
MTIKSNNNYGRYLPDYTNTSDYLFLPEDLSSKEVFRKETLYHFIILLLVFLFAIGLLSRIGQTPFIIVLSGAVALFYLLIMAFKLYMVTLSIGKDVFVKVPISEIKKLKDEDLPVYTILIPLYDEANVIPQIFKAMTAIDYPPEKLDIWITLEEYDHSTIQAIKDYDPPKHFKTLILPDVKPKTKPKALNVAFPHVRGEYLVIYDAEIVPDPDQLKKAVIAFNSHPEISCFQTRLDHYNGTKNTLTGLFNAEFSFYYDLFLPGLQKKNVPIPLSGHSTHFRTEVLKEIGAWDPYNVTEDCDLGIRLYRFGYRTAVLDSFSLEEATSDIKSWLNQRTRWLKGFIQTSAVHFRKPKVLYEELGGLKNTIAFALIVPGTVLVNIFNLVYWVLLFLWLFTADSFVQSLFPGIILYASVFSFIAGNFIFTYLNLLGVYRRERYSYVLKMVLSPIYWVLLAVAAVRASIEIFSRPHHWAKTKHGDSIEVADVDKPLAAEVIKGNEIYK